MFAKTLQAGYTSLAGPIAIGDTLEVAIEKLDGNIKGNVLAINNNATNINTNTNNIAAIGLVNATQTANIATNTAGIATNLGNIATNTTNISTNTTNIATNTGNIATNIADIATNAADITTAQTAADDAQTAIDNLSAVATIDAEGLTTFAATDKAVIILEDSAAVTEVIATITGGTAGQSLTIVAGALSTGTIDLTDSATCTADALRLDGTATAVLADGDLIELIYVGGCWNEVSRSQNSI